MANQTKKITEFPVLSGPHGNTFLVVAHTANGVTNTYTLSVTTLLGNSAVNTAIQQAVVANSTISVKKGTMLFDTTYLYIAVDNNLLKRIPLSSF